MVDDEFPTRPPGDPASSASEVTTRLVSSADEPAGVSLPPNFSWGDLQLVEVIGRGSYGTVYRAWDPSLARDIALKVVRPRQGDADSADEILREARLLARLRHPNIVTVHAAERSGDLVGIQMELLRGRSLADIVLRDGPCSAEEVTLIGLRLCDAVAAVHAAGLVHGDVKAHNVVREAGGRIVLTDFGAGRDLHRPAHDAVTVTPVYTAPEVLGGGRPSPSSDLYSLGVLLFFLTTGRYPVEGRTVQDVAIAHALGQRVLLSDCRAGLPEGFLRVVHRALAPAREDRYESAGAMLRDLGQALSGSAIRVHRGSDSHHPGVRPHELRRAGAKRRATGSRTLASPGTAIAGAAGLVAFIWVLGFLQSMAFDTTLGRQGFSRDTPLTWWVWGARSLVAPTVYVVVLLLLVGVARTLWPIACRFMPIVCRGDDGVRTRLSQSPLADAIRHRRTAAQLLLVAQLAAIALVVWRHWDLLLAVITPISTAHPALLSVLAPSDRHGDYRILMTLLAFAMTLAWYRLLTSSTAEDRVDPATAAAGIAAIVLVVLMAALPYRILFQSDFQRAEYAGEPCFILGENGEDVLLHCAEAAPPRNRRIRGDDAALARLPSVDGLFGPVGRE